MFTTDYDKYDVMDILRHAKQLEGHSLREYLDSVGINYTNSISARSRGKLGNEIERFFFGYKPNSDKNADFSNVGLELKVMPLKRTPSGALTPKERLVLSIINYTSIVEETWDNNTLLNKLKLLLLMFYIHDSEKVSIDLIFELIDKWSPSAKDLDIIRSDWENIVNKIKNGKAHEISEGDTFYLGACTKAANSNVHIKQPYSDIPAKPRAFALKSSYVKSIWQELSGIKTKSISSQTNIYGAVISKFKKLYGKSVYDIASVLSINTESLRNSKDFLSRFMIEVQRRLFGDKLVNLEEFQKSGIQVKNILLKPDGIPKEDMSFPYIKYTTIINQEWDDSDIKSLFENEKHLWLVFKTTKTYSRQRDLNLDDIIFEGAMFWNMPMTDLDGDVQKVWRDTIDKIKAGDYNHFTKMSENPVVHIRPKAQNAKDVMETPQGTFEKKKCFFLNRKYVAKQIKID